MSSDQLKLYPSGFLGSNTVAQTKPMDVIHRARDLLQVQVGRAASRHTANEEVMEVLARAQVQAGQHRTFEDTENILAAARHAFGTQFFGDWVKSQLQSPEFSDNHMKYLEDTFLYVYAGRPRSMSVRGWLMILTTQGQANRPKEFSDVVRHYVFADPYTSLGNIFTHQRSVTVDDFITSWVQRPNGADDLLSGLVILFGAY